MFNALATADTIREMSLDDLDDVMEIEGLCFASPWTRGIFEETLASSISSSFIMKRGLDTVGYIILYSVADEAHILNIAIHPRYRGEGCAAVLMRHIIDYFRKKAINEFYLEVREGNLIAIRLYQGFGFERIGIRKKYYSETNEDALVMRLSVHS